MLCAEEALAGAQRAGETSEDCERRLVDEAKAETLRANEAQHEQLAHIYGREHRVVGHRDLRARVAPIKRDGNCLFRAIAECVGVDWRVVKARVYARMLRPGMERWVFEYWSLASGGGTLSKSLGALVWEEKGVSVQAYAAEMQRLMLWGGLVDILVASEVFRTPIHGYEMHPDGGVQKTLVCGKHQPGEPILLLYTEKPQCHWDALVTVGFGHKKACKGNKACMAIKSPLLDNEGQAHPATGQANMANMEEMRVGGTCRQVLHPSFASSSNYYSGLREEACARQQEAGCESHSASDVATSTYRSASKNRADNRSHKERVVSAKLASAAGVKSPLLRSEARRKAARRQAQKSKRKACSAASRVLGEAAVLSESGNAQLVATASTALEGADSDGTGTPAAEATTCVSLRSTDTGATSTTRTVGEFAQESVDAERPSSVGGPGTSVVSARAGKLLGGERLQQQQQELEVVQKSDSSFQIFAACSTVGTLVLRVRSCTTISDIKRMACERSGIPNSMVRLAFRRRHPGDSETVASAGIGKEATIHIFLNGLLGGSNMSQHDAAFLEQCVNDLRCHRSEKKSKEALQNMFVRDPHFLGDSSATTAQERFEEIWKRYVEAAEAMAHSSVVEDALQAINATDAGEAAGYNVDEAHRGMNVKEFDSFCERVRKGLVKPTCVIDFAWEDRGGMNFEGNDRKLERMYCFDDPSRAKAEGITGERRVVVHAHTNLRWGDREKHSPSERALVVTSVNIRHATKKPGTSYSQEQGKNILVPVANTLRDYRALYKIGKVKDMEWSCSLRPCLQSPTDVPILDKGASELRYNQLRQVMALGETISRDTVISTSLSDTLKSIRGAAEFEIVGASSLIPLSVLPIGGDTDSNSCAAIGGNQTSQEKAPMTVPKEARDVHPEPLTAKPCILFVGVNGQGMPEISVREECEKVRTAFMVTFGINRWRDHVYIDDTDPSSRQTDLVDYILKYKPNILHIACHGESSSLLLACDKFVEDWLISRVIKSVNQSQEIRLVIANSCLSSRVAKLLSDSVEFVIGHKEVLPDSTAIGFSETFYLSLASGNTLEDSFIAASGLAETSYHLWAQRSNPAKMHFFAKALQPEVPLREVHTFGLEFDVNEFQPREGLMAKFLEWMQGTGLKLAVHGMGGSGKSTLVKMFMIQACRSGGGCDIGIFLNTNQLRTEYMALLAFLSRVGGKGSCCVDEAIAPEELRDSVHALLRELSGRWIVAIDDSDPTILDDSLDGMMKGFPWPQGRVVVTSRSDVWSKMRGFQGLHVQSFNEVEALSMVRKRVEHWSSATDDEILCFVSMLQSFPLALSQACATCSGEDVRFPTPLDYIRKHEKQSTALERSRKPKGAVGDDYPWSFLEVVVLSLQEIRIQIIEEKATEEDVENAMTVARKLSFLLPTWVPLNILGNADDLAEPIKLLKGQGIVSVVKGCVSMHPLTQLVFRMEPCVIQLTGRSVTDTVQEVAQDLQEAMRDYHCDNRSTFGAAAACAPHVVSMVRLAEETLGWDGCPKNVQGLAGRVADYCENIACAFDDALFLRTAQLESRSRTRSSPFEEAVTLNDIATLYRKKGNFSLALEKYTRALEIRQGALGAEDADLAVLFKNIGNVFFFQGELDQALEKYLKALEIQSKLVDDRAKLDMATTMMNIGNVYEAQGEFDLALQKHMESVDIKVNALGTKHVDVAKNYGNMANIYESQRQFDKAAELYEKTLGIFCEALGEDHTDVAATYVNIAYLKESMGKFDEALEGYEKALKIDKQALGDEHVDVAKTEENMGNIFLKQELYDAALQVFQRVLAIKERVYGTDHWEVSATLNGIATVKHKQGEFKESLQGFERALEIRRILLGDEDEDVAASMTGIANVLTGQGEYDLALEKHEKALEIKVNALGDENVDVAESLSGIAFVYEGQGKYDLALEKHTESMQLRLKMFGDQHVDVATSEYNMAVVYVKNGGFEEARRLFLRCSEVFEKVFGSLHHKTLDAMERAAQC